VFVFSQSILIPKLSNGSRFKLQEGGRVVGDGEVVEILGEHGEKQTDR
jgi:hypothetical protein